MVPRTVFNPQPNVESAVVRLDVREEPAVAVKDEKLFQTIVRASFTQRRKTIWNNLKKMVNDKEKEPTLREAFEDAGIDPSRRGESLAIAEFGKLADSFVAHELTDF